MYILKQVKLINGLKLDVNVMNEETCKKCGRKVLVGRSAYGKHIPIVLTGVTIYQRHDVVCKKKGKK